MNSSTLRGIFPDPKPVHRRNFVRENIKHLKEMQGYLQETKVVSKSKERRANKFKHVAPRVYSTMAANTRIDNLKGTRPVSQNQITKSFIKSPVGSVFHRPAREEQKIMHRGVQTERPEDVSKLYETGVLKYPSPSIVTQFGNKQTPHKVREQGDASARTLTKSMQKLDLDEKQNYIKHNINSLKPNKNKREQSPDPTLAPPTYQRGVVPKYLKDKKEPKSEVTLPNAGDFEGESVTGLVLLPEEERKEYLRVARENYAALIKELNIMPVSNDTLKKRKRKMEIEDELKRLDEVIKIFQKPKVFVKADI